MSRSVSGTIAPTSCSLAQALQRGDVAGVVDAAGRSCARVAAYCAGASGLGSAGDDRRVLGERRDDVVALARAGQHDGAASDRVLPSAGLALVEPVAAARASRAVRARISRSSAAMRCSMYQRSSSMRSAHGSDARPLTCAQPVMPGLDGEPPALAVGVLRDLHRDRRPRADDRHLAAQDVDQVRQLVERGAAQERADAGDARVALVDRHAGAHVLGARDHRAQLEHVERLAVAADAPLAVDRVARATRAGSPTHRAPAGPGRRRAAPSRGDRRRRRARLTACPPAGSQPAGVPWRSQSHRPSGERRLSGRSSAR